MELVEYLVVLQLGKATQWIYTNVDKATQYKNVQILWASLSTEGTCQYCVELVESFNSYNTKNQQQTESPIVVDIADNMFQNLNRVGSSLFKLIEIRTNTFHQREQGVGAGGFTFLIKKCCIQYTHVFTYIQLLYIIKSYSYRSRNY